MASLDGYVGSAEDSARIARMGKKRQEERRQYEEAQKKREERIADAGIRKFAGASTEQIEHAFKNETVSHATGTLTLSLHASSHLMSLL